MPPTYWSRCSRAIRVENRGRRNLYIALGFQLTLHCPRQTTDRFGRRCVSPCLRNYRLESEDSVNGDEAYSLDGQRYHNKNGRPLAKCFSLSCTAEAVLRITPLNLCKFNRINRANKKAPCGGNEAPRATGNSSSCRNIENPSKEWGAGYTTAGAPNGAHSARALLSACRTRSVECALRLCLARPSVQTWASSRRRLPSTFLVRKS